jgi:hypothetical protein
MHENGGVFCELSAATGVAKSDCSAAAATKNFVKQLLSNFEACINIHIGISCKR